MFDERASHRLSRDRLSDTALNRLLRSQHPEKIECKQKDKANQEEHHRKDNYKLNCCPAADIAAEKRSNAPKIRHRYDPPEVAVVTTVSPDLAQVSDADIGIFASTVLKSPI